MFTLMFGSYEFPNQTFEIEGLPIENGVIVNEIPRKHGGIILTPFLKGRKIKISGKIHNDAAETSHAQLLALQTALLAGEGDFYYREDRCIKCFTKSIKPDFIRGTDKAVMDVDIDLWAEQPFLYSAGASYSDDTAASGTTYPFDVFSGGGVFAEPIITIVPDGATISDDIQLENQTTGDLMRYRGDVGPGHTLVINTETLEVTMDGVDGISNFEGDFIRLAAGTNSFQYVGGNCDINIKHKYRWLG